MSAKVLPFTDRREICENCKFSQIVTSMKTRNIITAYCRHDGWREVPGPTWTCPDFERVETGENKRR